MRKLLVASIIGILLDTTMVPATAWDAWSYDTEEP